ncbi:hypothetical protein Q427_30820 [Halomonas sp. BC04]|nr:hypothetical protein Q427_30820 [Halomonas sp. BC04]
MVPQALRQLLGVIALVLSQREDLGGTRLAPMRYSSPTPVRRAVPSWPVSTFSMPEKILSHQ